MTIYQHSELAKRYCTGKGLEIGGAAHNPFGLDTLNVDFTDDMNTVFKQAEEAICGKKMPVDIVASGDDLPVADESQDFVVNSHVIEHFFDPIKALKEWHRVVKPGGCIFIIAPLTAGVPGEERPTTTLQELIDRHEGRIQEKAILAKIAPDPGGPLGSAIIGGILYDAKHGHWTVLDADLFREICDYLGFRIATIRARDDKAGNGFTVVIRKAGGVEEARDDPRFAFGCLVNDPYRLNTVLKKSDLPGKLHYIPNPESATKGLNQLLEIMEGEGADVAIFLHQDVYIRNGWLEKVKDQLALLPDSWLAVGVIGKDFEGRMCGKLHDMRIVDNINTEEIHDFPQPAVCMDECVIIVNLKKGFRFDESLDGFDLYGTLCVHQAWSQGGTAWIIDAWAEHYCMRQFSWAPDADFKRRYKWLRDKYGGLVIPDSTVFVSKPRFETSAALE